MRVLLLTNGLRFGGAERIVEALAEDLSAAGDAVEVVATTRGGAIADRLRGRGIPVTVLGLRNPLDATLPWRFGQILRRFRPDVVHSHLAVSDIVSALTPGPGARLATVHNPGVELGWTKRRLWRRALRRMDHVTAVSAAAAAGLPGRAEILHPSLLRLDRSLPDRPEARRRLGLPIAGRLVLGLGRLARVKGFDLLARVAPHLDATVAVIGEGPARGELAGGPLWLLGARADAATLLCAADVFVLPSRSEGFPQAALEAMAAGVPVVATAVGGTPELVRHRETGWLVPREDGAALQAALNRLLAAPEEASALARAARRAIAERGLTRADMVARHRDVYRRLSRQRSDT